MTAYGKVVATLVGPKLCPLGFLEQNSFLCCRRRSAISAMYTSIGRTAHLEFVNLSGSLALEPEWAICFVN